MARLKKSLAMLLVFAMIFSTMSVAASAWGKDSDEDNDIRFTVHFFRKDAEGNWVDAKGRVAPGDEVQARVYAETSFPTGSVTDAITFDENYFTQNIGTGAFVTNSNPVINSLYKSQGYGGSISWRANETLHRQNLNNSLVNYLVSKGYADTDYAKYDTATNTFAKANFDADYFNHTDIMIINAWTQGVNNKALPELNHNEDGTIAESDLDKWFLAYDLKVRQDRRPLILDTEENPNKGYAKVPEMYSKQSEYPLSYVDPTTGKTLKPAQFVDYGRGPEDQTSGACDPMTTWAEDPDFSTQAGYVSTTSYITFDPNGGTFADGSTKTKTVAGIIGTSATVSVSKADGSEFLGWELVSGSDNSMIFDYADKVLKATWSQPDPEKTTYIKRFWEMNTSGVYEIKMASDPIATTEGEEISADAPPASEGFYIDEETVKTPETSVLTKTADKDSSKNVLDVYYARNDYTVTYNYEDNGGKQKQVDYPVYHGATLPSFLEGVDGNVPEATGKDFSGWSTTENGAVIKLPTTVESNLTFHAVYVNETYSYTFYANKEGDIDGNGAFDDGKKLIKLVFEYGQDPAEVAAEIEKYIGDPSKPGYEFLGWEPYSTTPKENVNIYPEYQAEEYEVRFFDKDGKIIENNRPDDLLFFYGETVEADKHIPEGYKSSYSWTLKDSSTAVSFPYTVTEDVDFYATDSANMYDARFYINNELYKTVSVEYLGKIEIPGYTVPAGFEFSGWDIADEGAGEIMDNTNGKDFYATLTPMDIELTFKIEGQDDVVISGKFGEDVTGIPEIPAKEGYEPGTWSPEAPSTFPAQDTTYTATWAPSTNTLTFVDIENGVESTLGTKTAKTGETITAQQAPKKEGHTFTGWLCEDGETIIATAPTVMPAKSQKYVAQWTVNDYSFSFDANGGAFAEGAVAEGSAKYGSSVAVPVPSFEGYVFAGWADSKVENPTAADVILSKDATSIVLNGDVAYKAVWTKSVHTVTYDAGLGLITKDDGSRASKVEFTVAYGNGVPTVNDPELDGYEFIKWIEKDSGIAVPDSMPNESLYFVAEWEKLPDPEVEVEYKIYSVKQVEGSDSYADPVLVKTGYALPGTEIKVVKGDPANENEYKFSNLVPNPSQVLDESKPTSMVIVKEGTNELYIYSNLKEITVTFTTGDGTWADESTEDYTVSGKFGYEITAPESYPVKKGYTCIGWEGYTEGDTFAEDITVTPIWQIQKHNANFVVVDEEGNVKVSDTVEFEYGKDIILPSIVLPEGYEYVDGKGWDNVIPEGATMGEEDVTYTATIKPIDYTITYIITNSDVAAAPEAQPFNVGDDVTVKSATEVEGYDFIGWKTEDGATYEAGHVFENIKAGSFTLTGTYDPKEYQISFDTNGGGFIPSDWAEVGSPITELPEIPDDPDDDKLPLGWYIGEEKVELPFDMPAEDLVLTAKYSYKVAYEYTGAVPENAPQVPATRYVEPGETVDIEGAPVLDGYTFNGWLIDGEPAQAFVMQAKGVKITGNWVSNAADEYTVTYKYTGDTPAGAPAAPTPQAVKEGTTVTPDVPEFDGYTFNGWYLDGELVTSFVPEKDSVLTGYWTKNAPTAYNVKYVYTGEIPEGAPAAPEAELVEVGTEVIIEDAPEFDGYTFNGWFDESGAPAENFTMPAEEVVISGYWTKNAPAEYELSYKYTGEVPENAPELPEAKPVKVGETVDLKDVPSVDGYTFEGWYYNGEIVEEFEMPANPVVITGNWVKNAPTEYEVSFKYTGEIPENAPALPETTMVAVGETVDLSNVPSIEGYTFNGWYYNGEVKASFEMPANNVVITGNWEKNAPSEYELSFKYTGEIPEDAPALPEAMPVKVGETVDLKDVPSVDGYTFEGWYYNGEIVEEFEMPANPVVITGNWVKNAPTEYEVSFKYTGEIPENAPALPEATMVAVGETVDLSNVPSIEGYTFNGWYYNGEVKASFEMPANDVVITGNWEKNAPSEYELSFKYTGEIPEDAPALPEAKPVKVGETVDLKDVPSVDGYTFEGWYYNGEIVEEFEMPANPVVITGNWVKNAQDTFSVTYVYTGEVPEGTPAVPETTTAKVGSTVTVEEVPSLDGYIFSGWYYDGEVATSFEMPASNVVITGNWTEAPVVVVKKTLTLDPNGGTLKGSTEVFVEEYEVGTDIPPVVDPVRPGFRFIRWVDGEGNTSNVPGTMPNYDVTLTAEWEQLYTVTYVNEDGTVYEEFVNAGAAGESIPAPTLGDPEKDGYIFTGWVDATTGKPVTEIPVGGVTLKPVFEKEIPNTYSVTYVYTNETVPAGAPALPETKLIEAGATVTVAEVPALEGYEFAGWNMNGALITEETFVMPAEDVTIEGTWNVKEYTIILDATIGAFENGKTQFIEDVEYGAELKDIVPANPVKTGYTFIKWVDDEGNEVKIPATMPAEDIEAKAEWKINSHEIIFDSLGGTEVEDITLEYGAKIENLPVPSKEGFEFIGWFDKDGNQVDAEGATMPDHDIEAFAKWEAVAEVPAYELTIDANNGEFSDGEGKHTFPEVEEGASLEEYLADKPERDGYEFIGWFDEEGNKIDEETAVMGNGDMTIVAGWEEIKYTITYYIASGEAVNEYDSAEYAPGEAIIDPADPTLEGFTFVGWFDEDGNKIPDVMGNEDIEAYAKFEINTYTVTYLANGTVYAEYEVLYQESVPVPADPTSNDPNLVFAGWKPTVVSVMPAHDLVYVAEFVSLEADKYIAKFIVDGKTWDLQVLEEGEEIVLPENPTKFGHKFVGWKPDVPAYMPAEDMEFVAQWKVDETFIIIAVGGTVIAGGIIAGSIVGGNAAWITGVSIAGGIIAIVGVAALVKHTHTVTYIVDGEIYKSYKVVEGTKIPVPADPVKDGFEFDGWNPEVPEKMGSTDLTFEATWVEADGSNAGADDSDDSADDSDTNVAIPDTGSVAGGIAAFAIISGAAAAAYVFARKKKED